MLEFESHTNRAGELVTVVHKDLILPFNHFLGLSVAPQSFRQVITRYLRRFSVLMLFVLCINILLNDLSSSSRMGQMSLHKDVTDVYNQFYRFNKFSDCIRFFFVIKNNLWKNIFWLMVLGE